MTGSKKRRPKPHDGIERHIHRVGDNRAYDKIQSALIELDKIASDCETRWGIDRLPLLVDENLRLKFWSQQDKLDQAILENDPDAVKKEAEIMARGWVALERAAKASGAQEATGKGYEATIDDNRTLRVCMSHEDATKAQRDNPGLIVASVQEIAGLWKLWEGAAMVEKCKDAFPDAQIIKTSKTRLDDEIPF